MSDACATLSFENKDLKKEGKEGKIIQGKIWECLLSSKNRARHTGQWDIVGHDWALESDRVGFQIWIYRF